MSRHATLTVLAAALALAGCTMIPKYERPAAPVAANFAEPAASGVPAPAPAGATAARDLEWQQFFRDERMKKLIEIALQNNRDLRTAVLNVDLVRAQYQVRRADILPTVNAAIAGSREPGPNDSISSVYTAGIGVTSYELDLFGRVRSLSQAALATYFGSEESRKSAQITLIAAVANGYLALLADDELLKVTQATLGTREESFKLSKLKFDNGAASELDLRQAESLLEGARVTLQQQIRQRALDENLLVLLIGQPMPTDLPAGLTIADQALQSDLPTGMPSEVLVLRPDVRLAEQQLISANANIGAARAAFFPRISLTGSFGTASTELSGLFKGGTWGWTFAPQAVLPIFDAGRNIANLDVAKVNRDIAVASYEKSIQTAFREVSDALAGRATLSEQARSQVAQTKAAEATYRLADLRYRNGASSYLDALDAQRTLFLAQQATVQVQALQVQNQVTLYKVLGGGWTEPSKTR